MKYYVGLDVHMNHIQATMIDDQKKVVSEAKLECKKEAIEQFLSGIPRSCLESALEACGIWADLYDYLEERCSKVKLVNPLKTKAIASARIKTDKIDSKIIAELLRADMIAESYIPPKEVRSLREIIRHRQGLVKIRTSIKNRVCAILRKNNIKKPNTFSDIFTVKGMKWLKTINNGQIDSYLKLLGPIESEIKDIWHGSKNIPLSSGINLLKTMPGVGNVASIVIMSEIADIQRFKSPRQLCSYAGLVPSIHQSGETERRGGITKQGSRLLRWMLIQSAQIAVRQPGKLQNAYYKMHKKKHRNIAITAIARKMLYITWFMLTNKQPYIDNHLASGDMAA